MLTLKRPLVFFDLETTGIRVESDRIVQLAAVKWHPDGHQDSINEYLNPTIPIPAEASAVHGITNEQVAHCPTFADRADVYAHFFADCDLAGFNSNRFDIPLLIHELARTGHRLALTCRYLDVCEIFHTMEPRNLAAAHRLYCGSEMVDAHNAMADVEATMAVLRGMLTHYASRPEAPGKPELRIEADVDSLSAFCRTPSPDPSRKLVVGEDGQLIFTIGKYKGQALTTVAREEPGYLQWLLTGDFPAPTKQLVRQALVEVGQ